MGIELLKIKMYREKLGCLKKKKTKAAARITQYMLIKACIYIDSPKK